MKGERRASGSARMVAIGWQPVQIWFAPAEKGRLRKLCRRKGMTQAAFCRAASLTLLATGEHEVKIEGLRLAAEIRRAQ